MRLSTVVNTIDDDEARKEYESLKTRSLACELALQAAVEQVQQLHAANKARDELAAQCAGERDYWEQCVKDAAARAGIDVSGTLGNASLHLIVEEIVRLKAAVHELEEQVNRLEGSDNKARAEVERLIDCLVAEVERLKEDMNIAHQEISRRNDAGMEQAAVIAEDFGSPMKSLGSQYTEASHRIAAAIRKEIKT